MGKKSRRPGRANKASKKARARKAARTEAKVAKLSQLVPGLDHRTKIHRAEELLNDLENEIKGWSSSHPYRTLDELDEATNEIVLSVEISTPQPERCRILIGEFLHALRSSLDLLVYKVSENHAGGELSPELARRCEFPIGSEPLSTSALKKIAGLPDAARDVILAQQPSTLGDDYADDPLWQLHELERFDKHRKLLAIGFAQDSVGLGFPNQPGFRLSTLTFTMQKTINGPTEVARYSNDSGFKLPLFLEFTLLFGDTSPLPDHFVVPVLRDIRNHVLQKCVAPLEGFL